MRHAAATLFLLGFLLPLIEIPCLRAQGGTPNPPADLNSLLEPLRTEQDVPALAAAVVRDGRIVAIGAVGVCKLGAEPVVRTNYRFHLGSDTKAMTATVAAMLVEEGRLDWKTTVAEVFPDEKNLDPACAAITFEQLLNHRAGLPHNLPSRLPYQDIAWQETTRAVQQRLYLVRDALNHPPETPPGTAFAYSDVGYAVAGAMMETRANQSWEDLMQTRLFDPLEMHSAGFGYPPRVGGKVFGHVRDKEGKFIPVESGPGDDDPPALGPAGKVHCSVEDWAKFAILQLHGWHADTPLLKRAGFAKLQTPPEGQDYAMGWLALPHAWAGRTTLSHEGSNGKFYTLAWLVPGRKLGILVAVSVSGNEAQKICRKVILTLLKEHRPMLGLPPG